MAEDFFSGVEQKALNVSGLEAKIPAFNRDFRIIAVYCLAPAKKLSKLLPDFAMAPTQMLPGTGVVQFTVYEHRDSDLGPYKEMSVVVPLYSPQFAKLPFYNLRKMLGSGHVYNFLLHRGTDSEAELRVMGEYFLWPMFPVSVEFTESDDWFTGEVKDGDDLIFRLRGRKIPAEQSMISHYSIFVPRHQQPTFVDINFRQIATTRDSSAAELTLGSSHPVARELSEVIKSTKSGMYIYAPSCQFILYDREGSS
jgi:hypothetical protein